MPAVQEQGGIGEWLGGKLLHENPGEVASNLGCTTTVVQWWVGRGVLREGAVPPSWPL